ncbi:MAG: creatininase family protein [Actinobacteria bacterium]|nr:MAG: creatininase family protein [Actinomycetota bacterium]TMM27821.1 MAG: creatininase family protein [Actinomycetota bacterium]
MRIRDLNWMQLAEYLERDDRIVLPLGSTEQHAYLSLETDNMLAERVSAEAAEPIGVPVLPVLPYGLTPYFAAAYPGSPTLRLETFLAVIRDLLDSLYRQGFRRFLLVNGHGGNTPAGSLAREWTSERADAQAIFHNWWVGPKTWAVVESTGKGSHASWMENFPWTRLAGVELPDEEKPMLDEGAYRVVGPDGLRDLIGDGSFGGLYQRDDEEMLRIWQTGVEEVRELLESGWRRE